MSKLQEYVVTLKNKADLDDFYDDMETPGGNLYIPKRKVEVANRREISRNTHYYLSKEEAEQLKQDPRVLDVEIPIRNNPNIGITPCYQQHSDFWSRSNKSSQNPNDAEYLQYSAFLNWGLFRSYLGQQVAGWGSDANGEIGGEVKINAEGNNVDVVIVDGFVLPHHPEFAQNPDGSGGSRVVQYNWYSLNPTVAGKKAGTYSYTTEKSQGNIEHGNHVAGLACGNTNGWARKANIYNISPYGTDSNQLDPNLLFDYIRTFHTTKSINETTKRRNPTICNNSWATTHRLWGLTLIDYLFYRGSTIRPQGSWTLDFLRQYGFAPFGLMSLRVTSIDVDVEDAIEDGVIMVGAAGNFYETAVDSTHPDYLNRLFYKTGESVRYNAGPTPGAATNVICVGAVDTVQNERKSDFSTAGTRVDIFAPGTMTNSSVDQGYNKTATSPGPVKDIRNQRYKQQKVSGTSMASPQVAGMIACVMEIYPRMTQAMAQEYISHYAGVDQLNDFGTADDYSGGGAYYGLRGAANKYLKHHQERKSTGAVFPRTDNWLRGTSGSVYPRSPKRKSLPR